MPVLKPLEEVAARILQEKRLQKVVPELPKGGLDILPLEAPHIAKKELPLYANPPESMEDLKALVGNDPELAKQATNKFATQAGAKKERQLEEYFAKKQAGEQTGTVTEKLPGTTIMPTTQSVPKLINPADVARRAYDWYNQKLEHAGNKAADTILQAVTPQGLPNRDKIIAETAPAVSLAAQLVGDPTNYIGPGEAKLAVNAVEKAGGVLSHGKQIAQATADAIVRQKRAEEALKVLNYMRQEPSTAQKLATKGAPVVQPVGQIFRAK